MKRCKNIVLHCLISGCLALALIKPAVHAQNIPKKSALHNLMEAVDSGNPAAIYRLASLHNIGYDSIKKDSVRALALFRQAAEMDYPPALNYLGMKYYLGQGVPENKSLAIDLIEKSALKGNLQAANNLGWLLTTGQGVVHDRSKAIFWLEKAATGDTPEAQSMLADLILMGNPSQTDSLKASELYLKASRLGLRDAEAKYIDLSRKNWDNLSPDSILTLAIDLSKHGNLLAAATLYQQGTSQGDPRAMALLGDAYSRGAGLPYDYNAAIHYFLQAALKENPAACYYMAELLDFFPDILQDEQFSTISKEGVQLTPESMTADFWYEKAKSHGINSAEEAEKQLYSLPASKE